MTPNLTDVDILRHALPFMTLLFVVPLKLVDLCAKGKKVFIA